MSIEIWHTVYTIISFIHQYWILYLLNDCNGNEGKEIKTMDSFSVAYFILWLYGCIG